MPTSTKPWVMGISSSHNGGVCLLHGDEVVVAIQEERLLRYKRAENPSAYASLAIAYCLQAANIQPSDLSMIVTCSTPPAGTVHEDVVLNPALRPTAHGVPVRVIGHHRAHAVAAHALSGFAESLVLVIDGYGSMFTELDASEQRAVPPAHLAATAGPDRGEPREIISVYRADAASVTCTHKHISSAWTVPKTGMPYYWSLGTMYESVGALLFGSRLDGAGKVMGLAPCGRATIPAGEFVEWSGGTFAFRKLVPDRFREEFRWPDRRQECEDLAASVQAALEEALLSLVSLLRSEHPAAPLCYAGGVALNCVANERLHRESGFERIFVMPAAEDSGTAVGAAFHGLWELTGRIPSRQQHRDAMGQQYGGASIRAAIREMPAVEIVPASDPIARAAALLAEGRVLGWLQGGSELGPRALGQRSIVADPRRAEMKDRLNQRIKFREGFRPFAPAILEERLADWFDVGASGASSPFMLRALPILSERRSQIPAVAHVDGTGRVQTVTREANEPFYRLLSRFYELTGVPVLLNTSFNIAGEPIVETPTDALWCLLSTGLEYCVLGGELVTKAGGFASVLELTYEVDTRGCAMYAARLPFHAATERGPGAITTHVFSAHADRLRDLEPAALARREALLRVTSTTPWGPVIHFMDAGFLPLLNAVDPAKTGAQLAEELAVHGPAYDRGTVERMLRALVRASIIRPRRHVASERGGAVAAAQAVS